MAPFAFNTASLSSASVGAGGSINYAMIQKPPGLWGFLKSGDQGVILRPSSIGGGITTATKGKAVVALAIGGGGGGVAKYKGTQKREKQLTEMIEEKVKEAKEVCDGDERSDECKVAWDEVEEVSQAKADLRLKLLENQDPLESFCHDHPETDECRIYDD